MSWKQLKITRIWQILLAFMAFSFFVWTFTFTVFGRLELEAGAEVV